MVQYHRYTFSFGLLVTVISGIVFSLASKGYKNKTDTTLMVYDLLSIVKRNIKVTNQQDNNRILDKAIEMSENEALTL